MKRTLITAGAMVLALGAGALGGHALLQRDLAAGQQQVIDASHRAASAMPTIEPAPSEAEAYDTYLEVYGQGNGCREDFDANFKGFVRYDELPEALQQQVAEDALAMHNEPFLEDYEDGSVLTVRSTPDYLVYLGAYDGACDHG